MRLCICLIVNLSLIVFAPYHIDLLFLLNPAHECLLPDCSVRVEKIRTSPFLTLAYPFFFCSPVKRSVKGGGEKGEEERESDKRRREGEESCTNPLAGRGRKRVAHEHLRVSHSLFPTMGFVRSLGVLNQVQIENYFIPDATS